jgi:hypothetical protein
MAMLALFRKDLLGSLDSQLGLNGVAFLMKLGMKMWIDPQNVQLGIKAADVVRHVSPKALPER